MKIGDIVKFPDGHHMSNFLVGLCVVDEVRKYRIIDSKKTKYHIKTINKNSQGTYSMTWVHEDEVMNISEIRNFKLKELGIN